MKTNPIRKSFLAITLAVLALGTVVPAHATVSGSEPRPDASFSFSDLVNAFLAAW